MISHIFWEYELAANVGRIQLPRFLEIFIAFLKVFKTLLITYLRPQKSYFEDFFFSLALLKNEITDKAPLKNTNAKILAKLRLQKI